MNEQQIYATLTEIFHEMFDDESLVVTPELSAQDVPEWDSFNHINIIVATEMRLGVKFKASEIDELKNVGEFVRLIMDKLQPA